MTQRCTGRYQNGPEKRFARCSKCSGINYEANEGDPCVEDAWLAERRQEAIDRDWPAQRGMIEQMIRDRKEKLRCQDP